MKNAIYKLLLWPEQNTSYIYIDIPACIPVSREKNSQLYNKLQTLIFLLLKLDHHQINQNFRFP